MHYAQRQQRSLQTSDAALPVVGPNAMIDDRRFKPDGDFGCWGSFVVTSLATARKKPNCASMVKPAKRRRKSPNIESCAPAFIPWAMVGKMTPHGKEKLNSNC
mmetsp:Transcript_3216/g.8330  ORF Transcript_3216/g.8330 Transcript_3216/m.8330 type:complete len:103 (-) Transcript_3216:537-845(-)